MWTSKKSAIMTLIASIGLNVLWIGYTVLYLQHQQQQQRHEDLSPVFYELAKGGPRALQESIQASANTIRKKRSSSTYSFTDATNQRKPKGKFGTLMESHVLQDVSNQYAREMEKDVKRSRWVISNEPYLDKDLPLSVLRDAYGAEEGEYNEEEEEKDFGSNTKQQPQEQRPPQPPDDNDNNNKHDDYYNEKPNSVQPLARTDDNMFRMPLTYVSNKDKSLYSTGHCIGDNFRDFRWQYTSCHVNLLCYDMKKEDWVIFGSPYEKAMRQARKKGMADLDDDKLSHDLYSSSSDLNMPWSIGVINPQWVDTEWIRVKRKFRRVQPQGFYVLPANVVMLPFHSMAGFNPGHLIWDDFMAFFLLADTFDLWKKDKHFLYMREAINPAIWATCEDDGYENLSEQCRSTFPKFFPLMGSYTVLFDKPPLSTLFPDGNHKSQYICAPEGIAGLGMMSDHGAKQHGWWSHDYEWNHNVGRGPQLYKFRSFLMENMGVSPNLPRQQERPLVLFSQWSSRRSFDFTPFAEHLQEAIGQDNIEVRLVEFRTMDLQEQIALVSQASMLISVAGGGTFTAMALPRGASLVLYYECDVVDLGQDDFPEEEQRRNGARLDYDVWNNVAYLRTHWLPFHGNGLEPIHGPGNPILETLVRHELDIMAKQGY